MRIFRTNSLFLKQSSRGVLRKRIPKICNKFTGEHPCRSVISITLLCKFIEIARWHGCSPVNLLHIFRTPFYNNTYGKLLQLLPNIGLTNNIFESSDFLFNVFLGNKYMLKFNNKYTRKRCEICQKLTIMSLLLTLNIFHTFS